MTRIHCNDDEIKAASDDGPTLESYYDSSLDVGEYPWPWTPEFERMRQRISDRMQKRFWP